MSCSFWDLIATGERWRTETWSPKTHIRFPKSIRTEVFTWLLVANKKKKKISKDMKILICKYIASHRVYNHSYYNDINIIPSKMPTKPGRKSYQSYSRYPKNETLNRRSNKNYCDRYPNRYSNRHSNRYSKNKTRR